jgi:hypothetical protein
MFTPEERVRPRSVLLELAAGIKRITGAAANGLAADSREDEW